MSARVTATARALRVLIVEDCADTAVTLRTMLAGWEFDSLVCTDERRAQELAETYCPDVVLLDLALPWVHGYDVARRLRASARTGNPIIVAITAWGQEADRQQSRAAGIDHHLVKPVAPNVLRLLLEEARESRGLA